MLILGLHFGHDASVTVLRNGDIAAHVSRERESQVKHAIALDQHCIELALAEARTVFEEIDYCAITSTQNIELIFEQGELFNIIYGQGAQHEYRSSLVQFDALAGTGAESRMNSSIIAALKGKTGLPDWMLAQFNAYFPSFRERPDMAFHCAQTMDNFVSYEHWNAGAGLAQLAQRNVRTMLSESNRLGFHYPLTVSFRGTSIPGYFIHHHMSHASASYYLSDFDNAAIFSHDGFSNGVGYNSGLFYYATGNKLYPLSPHHLNIGSFYDQVGIACGLHHIGPAGKLMGLAGYGNPVHYAENLVGNYYDHAARGIGSLSGAFLEQCKHDPGAVLAAHWDEKSKHAIIENQGIADIAASAQAVFDRTRLKAVDTLHQLLANSDIETDNLCLTGGTALNCPSNTSIFNESKFAHHFIEPCCDDSGLSIGAALNVYHNIAGFEKKAPPKPVGGIPYIGPRYKDSTIREALDSFSDVIRAEKLPAAHNQAAKDLKEQKIIALFNERSEVGPRALGHRSLLADPTNRSMLQKINRIKNREIWRPLAPVVLGESLASCFRDGPNTSPYMLYNYQVTEEFQNTSICHIDNTARVQTVDESAGLIFEILSTFSSISDVPVLLNTSFNGRDTPIVESPRSAIETFLSLDIDVLYLGPYRVVRTGS